MIKTTQHALGVIFRNTLEPQERCSHDCHNLLTVATLTMLNAAPFRLCQTAGASDLNGCNSLASTKLLDRCPQLADRSAVSPTGFLHDIIFRARASASSLLPRFADHRPKKYYSYYQLLSATTVHVEVAHMSQMSLECHETSRLSPSLGVELAPRAVLGSESG